MTERTTDQQPEKKAASPDKKTRFADFANKRAQLVAQTDEEVRQPESQTERESPALPPPASTPRTATSTAQSTADRTSLRTSRAPGKKTDPNFVQVTVYLHKDVHNTARKLLFDDRRQFSDLVDELVKEWIRITNISGSPPT